MTNSLHIARALADEMIDHLLLERPNEGCGLLAGTKDMVTRVIKMTNEEASPVRYKLVDLEYKRAQDLLDEDGLDLIGSFHSHTRTAAVPSPTDVKKSMGDLIHVIVSLKDELPDIRAFRIVKENWTDADGEIVEVPVVVEG